MKGVDRDPLSIPPHPVQHPEVDVEFGEHGRVMVIHGAGRSIDSLWRCSQITRVLPVAVHLKRSHLSSTSKVQRRGRSGSRHFALSPQWRANPSASRTSHTELISPPSTRSVADKARSQEYARPCLASVSLIN